MRKNYSYIDLFSGCGGLSLGLENVGFSLSLAVEKSSMAAETFYHNFIKRIEDKNEWSKFCGLPLIEQAKQGLVINELSAVLEEESLLKKFRKEGVDLVAGGPPCQGFSIAGLRNPNDQRNKLPWQFLQFIENVNPKAVIMENVLGMKKSFRNQKGLSTFEQVRLALEQTGKGYVVQPLELNAMNFGVPQNRSRVILVGIRKDIARKVGINSTRHIWKSDLDVAESLLFNEKPSLAPNPKFKHSDARKVKDAFWDINEDGYAFDLDYQKYKNNDGEYARLMRDKNYWAPFNNSTCKVEGSILLNHNKRNHSEQVRERFMLYQYLSSQGITTKVLNIPSSRNNVKSSFDELRSILSCAQFPAKNKAGVRLAMNLDELAQLVINLNTRKHSQRPLIWDLPSPTMVSLPDDFVHPIIPRTLSVREMARIQSFPDAFEFRSKETTGSHRRRFEVPQYTQVGNAVPPLMARAVGEVIFEILNKFAEMGG